MLKLVANNSPVAVRAQEAFAQARLVASEHANMLRDSLLESERLAQEVAAGGDNYPVGIRNLAREIAAHLKSRLATLDAIGGR